MSWHALWVLMEQEVREAARNRWFVLCAVIFAGLSLALSALGMSGLGLVGVTGFGRTTASLLNLVLLIVPLMGLLLGAMSVASEREQGILLTVLAQPVTPQEVLIGKFLGLGTALIAAVLVGFGLSAMLIARYGGMAQIGDYLVLVGCTALLGLAMLALGLCVSVLAPRGTTAVGLALTLWLGIVFAGDLGVMGSTVVLHLTPRQLLWLLLANPTQLFKLATMRAMQGNLEVLGPAALHAAGLFGIWLLPMLLTLLAAWVLAPLGVAWRAFCRRGACG